MASLNQLYIMLLENTKTNTFYYIITNDLVYYVPVGIVVHINSIPYIYFDELNGPTIFEDFGPNLYKHSLNWNQIYKREEEEAHRNLNILILQQEDIKYVEEPYLQLWAIDI